MLTSCSFGACPQQGCLRHSNTTFGPTVLSMWNCSLFKRNTVFASIMNQRLKSMPDAVATLRHAAYQAALATQVLQREFAALQTQHSSTNLQSLDSQQHPQQQQPQVAAAPGAASVAMYNASPTGKRPGQGWPASAPAQQGHSPAKQQPAQQRQKQQQQRAAPATQQQGMPAKQQQARQMPMLQQQSAVVLPVQPKKSQNHMFWDVAPRTINPAQVCAHTHISNGLVDGACKGADLDSFESFNSSGRRHPSMCMCKVGADRQPAS